MHLRMHSLSFKPGTRLSTSISLCGFLYVGFLQGLWVPNTKRVQVKVDQHAAEAAAVQGLTFK